MIELGLNKPQGLDGAKKITALAIMPELEKFQVLICAYDVFSFGEKKYVICQDDDDIKMMGSNYGPNTIDWYICQWLTPLPEHLIKKVV
ncbi:MAG: hypothetical protein V1765_00165 [bacterium]